MKKTIGGLLLLLAAGAASAQPEEERSRTAQAETPVSYVPKIDGAIKAKMEIDLNRGEYRFNVRNSRFGVRGNVSRNMSYRLQVDFSNEGKVSILDSYVAYKTHRFEAIIGQQQYHFSTDLDRGPSTNMFANRSFLAKYLTSYYGSEVSDGKTVDFVRTLGSRDLGAMFTYSFRAGVPMKVYAGLFNGAGSNNPEWGKKVNVVGRLEAGGEEGLRAAVAYYDGFAPLHTKVKEENGELKSEEFEQKMRMVGAELRYVKGGFFVEGEYARRYLGVGAARKVMTTALIHGYYKIDLPENSFADHLAPIVRWDVGNDVDYLNTDARRREVFDANRITVGLNVGFGKKLIRSEIRFNYEKYLPSRKPSDFARNKLLHDKFTIEVVAAF